ncbi:CHAD domain-containing protein [Phormidesmis priestleyi ULC007]|uniref:CHAD domain-containing protein n=1 Tax=Phormidesmis priestleyi ULC007 TaxID=1920490 RepID=A0A2T1DI56_9CYAN|nr:CHAD domain-containing protein [Phormidesmis priestleyi]PSB20190.1 CHAD domain-containing protein [Phormidesmis priestleyi ULC007]
MYTEEKKVTQLATLDSFAYSAIEKHFKKSIKHESDVLDDKDPELLHQMRVGLRRLRTAVDVFDFAVDLPKPISDRTISKIAHSLGAVRDLDVLTAELNSQQQSSLPIAEQNRLETLLKKMNKQRKRDFAHLQQTLKGSDYDALKDALKGWLKKPHYQSIAQLPIQEVLPDLLLPLISETLLHPAWLVNANFENGAAIVHSIHPEMLDDFIKQHGPTLHDLRKQMKRVRYQTELFVDFYDSAYAEQIEDFKAIQEVLGQIQDRAVLQGYLGSQIKESVQDVYPTLSKQLDQKVADALRTWQTLQQRYLDPEFRKKLRSLI